MTHTTTENWKGSHCTALGKLTKMYMTSYTVDYCRALKS